MSFFYMVAGCLLAIVFAIPIAVHLVRGKRARGWRRGAGLLVGAVAAAALIGCAGYAGYRLLGWINERRSFKHLQSIRCRAASIGDFTATYVVTNDTDSVLTLQHDYPTIFVLMGNRVYSAVPVQIVGSDSPLAVGVAPGNTVTVTVAAKESPIVKSFVATPNRVNRCMADFGNEDGDYVEGHVDIP